MKGTKDADVQTPDEKARPDERSVFRSVGATEIVLAPVVAGNAELENAVAQDGGSRRGLMVRFDMHLPQGHGLYFISATMLGLTNVRIGVKLQDQLSPSQMECVDTLTNARYEEFYNMPIMGHC